MRSNIAVSTTNTTPCSTWTLTTTSKLETIHIVFQEFRLAEGTWDVNGERVRPQDIQDTALLTIEGELDDISGSG
ncbi:MAG: Intracellular PHB depolymerase [uncultured Caballeronia sp.]|nr:MAG: Intracellular PHB depolymerase [uncultured Caballeronia sp.]